MYIDALLLLADGQTTTTSGASTSHIDTTVGGGLKSIAMGDQYNGIRWVVKMEAAAVGTATATAKWELQTCDVDTFDATAVTLAATSAFLTAALTKNLVVSRIKMPLGVKRYIRSYMTVGGTGVFTTLTRSSFLTTDVDNNLP